MQYRFHHIHEAPEERVRDHIRDKAELIERRLDTFEDDLVTLDIRLDHRPERYGDRRNASNYGGHLVLRMPGQSLQNIGATGHGESWTTACNEAFVSLENQLDKVLARLHRKTDIHAYQHRPSWEREGAELLGEPQMPPNRDDDEPPARA